MTTDPTPDGDRPAREPMAVGTGPTLRSRLATTVGRIQLSGAVAGLVALLGAVLLGAQLVGIRLTLLALAAGVTLSCGAYALTSDSPRVLLVGGAVVTPAAVLLGITLAVGVAFGLRTGAVGSLTVAVVLLLVTASFAAVLVALPLPEQVVVASAFVRFVAMLVPLTVVQVLVVVAAMWETVVTGIAGLAFDSPEPLLAVARALLAPRGPVALLTFLLYVVLVVFLVRVLFSAIPVVALFPPRRRPAVAARVDAARSTLDRAVLVAGAVAVAVYAVAVLTGTQSVAEIGAATDPPLSGVVVALLTATPVRVLFVLVIGFLLTVLVAERARRRARRLSEADLLRNSMPPLGAATTALAAGLGLAAVLTPAALLARVPVGLRPTARSMLSAGVLPATLLVAFGALIVVGVLLIVLTVLGGTTVLPARAMGATLASAAVFGLALALVLFRGPPAVAFAGGALALVAWDAGEYATGLREELEPGADTTRGELVHVGGSLAVGVGAVVVAGLLDALVTGDVLVPSVPDATLGAGALTLAFAVVVVLVSSLRE